MIQLPGPTFPGVSAAPSAELRRMSQDGLGPRTRPLVGRVNPRRMTTHQLAEWAAELHADGMLNWAEYGMAGFPAELHPDYDRTVGALTGERADPDQPRDMIAIWEDRFHRETRCLGAVAASISGRIVELLRWQASTVLQDLRIVAHNKPSMLLGSCFTEAGFAEVARPRPEPSSPQAVAGRPA